MRATVKVTARGAARIRRGHPWIYAADVDAPSSAAATDDVVDVIDPRGHALGSALHAPGAPLVLRMLGGANLDLDRALLEARIASAFAFRQRLFPTADGYRVVHGEADRLPGLIVDRYGDVAVLQTMTRAMDARKELIAEVVARTIGARLVIARDDGSARDLEALPRERRVLVGDGATVARYHDAGNEFEIDVMADKKTGGFLDQAENHARAREYAVGDCLDAFSYHGGFALALARGGATSVLALDESADATARTRANVTRNGFDAVVEVRTANAFDVLRALESEGRRFDIVVIDPPALGKRKGVGVAGAADRAYKELNLRGLRLVRPGGTLFTCSCSGKVTPADFGALIDSAAQDSGRAAQLLERRGAGRDHPVLLGVPETDYLKCWILRVL